MIPPGLILENKGMRADNQKRVRKSSKKPNCEFFLPPILPNLGHLERYTPGNGMCLWSF